MKIAVLNDLHVKYNFKNVKTQLSYRKIGGESKPKTKKYDKLTDCLFSNLTKRKISINSYQLHLSIIY